MARLVVGSGADAVTHELAPHATTLGRAPDNDIVLAGDGISRYHARIEPGAASHAVTDLGSKNGTFVNGTAIKAETPLRDGDRLSFAGLECTFHEDNATVTMVLPSRPAATAAPKRNASLLIDVARAEVHVRGSSVALPPKEFRALSLLYGKAGAVVSKDELAQHVWPEYDGDVSDYNIHQVISRLRRAIEEDPAAPKLLITRAGFGYILVSD
jgi:hypothetical protein